MTTKLTSGKGDTLQGVLGWYVNQAGQIILVSTRAKSLSDKKTAAHS